MAWGVEQIVRRGSRALLDLERASWRAVCGKIEGFPPYELWITPPSPSTGVLQPCSLAHRNLTVWFARYRPREARVGSRIATNITIYVGTEKLTEDERWL